MNPKILVVDDEPVITEMLRQQFTREGYEVFTAGSAEEALVLIARQPMDVVISDEMMPGMKGTEFLSILRRRQPETIRIMLTGYATLDGVIRAINEGEIYRYFTKPCNLIDIVVTIRQALRQKELSQQNKRLLQMVKKQSTFLHTLEKKYPGITRVQRNKGGDILIDQGSVGYSATR